MHLFAHISAKDSAPNRSGTVLRTYGRQREHILHIVVTGRASVIRNENLREPSIPEEEKPIRGGRLAEISPTDQQAVSRNCIPAEAPVGNLGTGGGKALVDEIGARTGDPRRRRLGGGQQREDNLSEWQEEDLAGAGGFHCCFFLST